MDSHLTDPTITRRSLLLAAPLAYIRNLPGGNQVDPEASQEEAAIGADTKAAHPPSSCVSALD